MNKVNKIILSKRNFGSDEDLYKALAEQLHILFKSGYQCVVSDIDPKGGTICIEYAQSGLTFGEPKPYWLLDLEAVEVKRLHEQVEIELAKQKLEKAQDEDDDEEEVAKIKEGGEA